MTAPRAALDTPAPWWRRAATQVDARTWAVLGLGLAVLSVSAWWSKELIDFHVFFTAGKRALDGSALYRAEDGDMPFKYAPVIALLLAPIALVPERLSVLLWLLAAAVAMVRWLRFSRAMYAPTSAPWQVLLVVLWLLPFHRHLLELGQCDLFILILAAESEVQREKRPYLSGALLSGCCLLKPPFLLLVALSALFREWRRLSAFALTLALAAVAPALRYGFDRNLELLREWRQILAATTAPLYCAVDNQSVAGIVCKLIAKPEEPSFRWLVLIGSAAVFAACAWPPLRLRNRSLLLAAAFYLSAVLSPLGWRTNLLAMAPLSFLIVRSRHWKLLAIAPSLNAFCGVLVFDLFGRAVYASLINVRFFGVLALATAIPAVWVTAREARSTSDSASREGSSAPGDPGSRLAPR